METSTLNVIPMARIYEKELAAFDAARNHTLGVMNVTFRVLPAGFGYKVMIVPRNRLPYYLTK